MTINEVVPTQGIPEQGQLVDVRHRQYVVTDVARSTLPAVDLVAATQKAHHLVSLSSVEDDALGEELEVIWELEPGARVHNHAALPAPVGFDTPARLDTFLNAVRWGVISSADSRALQAPFRSGIDIEDYQLDPLVRAIEMPRANLLIADDVGLGKTIEAGLVIQELILRQRARTVLIVCPAALQVQWRDQMRDKFGLEFRIVDSQMMKELRRTRGIHVNPWQHFPRLITSVDFLKREHPMRLMREVLPGADEVAYPRHFDILVVDEAHNVAPSGPGRYAIDSQRTLAIRALAPHFEHKLFLTATPHNGYVESFSALLELLDNQRFARGVPPEQERLAPVMVRRMKSELPPRWDGTPRFPKRELEAIEVAYTDAERQAHHWLQQYTEMRQAHPGDAAERTATEFVLKLLKKRLLSSPAAFASTLAQHEATLTAAGRPTEVRPPRKPSAGLLRAMLDGIDEEYADDDAYEEATRDAVHTSSDLFRPLTAQEKAILHEMRRWAEGAAVHADSKARTLLSWLKKTLKPDGKWSDERVIIFTEYRDTQKWLQTLLAAESLASGERLLTLYGGMDTQERERIKAAFQASPTVSPVRILLATDAASEGIDLQLHCHRLIHYEIPWNPNRMEQRNGRIDRHGQRHNPLVFHFVPQGYARNLDRDAPVGQLEGDLEFLMRAVRKVEQIREDLGKVGPVIADQVAQAMLGKRQRLDTLKAENEGAPVRQLLKFERDLNAQIKRLKEQLDDSRKELHLSPENVQAVVETALELAGQPPLRQAQLDGVSPVFYLPPLKGSWARSAEGLPHPHTGITRPIVFDENLARGRDDVVLAHLNHRLVQMSLRLLRAEVWNSGQGAKLNRVTTRVSRDRSLQAPVVVAHARLVVTGGQGHRLHEEVIQAGGEIVEGRFRRLGVRRLEEILAEVTDREPPAALQRRFQETWPTWEPSLRQSLDARGTERTESLDSRLAERRDTDIQKMTAILRELERAIRDELEEPEYQQLSLFSEDEKQQYHRNVQALQARLAQIPGEIEQEADAIRQRYANPQSRLFPVAVTFIVPSRLNG